MIFNQITEEIKLIRVLKTLETKELKRFKAFVESPYVNKNGKLTVTLDYLSKFHPKFSGKSFTEEKIFEYVFPGMPFKGNVITKLFSKIFKLLVDFFAVEEALNTPFNMELSLLCIYSKKGLMNDFDRLSKKIRKNQEQKIHLDTVDFHNRFKMEKEVNRVVSTRQDKGVGDAHFKNAASALDIYYLYTKLVYTCQEINRGNIIKGLEVDSFNFDIVNMVPKTPYRNEPIIDIWYSAYLLLSEENKVSNFKELKKKLYQYSEIPNPSQLRILFTYLENTALEIFKERETLYKEMLELYNFQLERDVLFNDEIFTPGILKNYMTASLNLNENEQARNFLGNIKESIAKAHPNSLQYCKAMLLFSEEEYDTALDILNELHFNNIIMKLNERTMRLKIYYHLGYYDFLADNLNTFRVFLTNNKSIISDKTLDSYRRFSNYLSKILKDVHINALNMEELEESIQLDSVTVERNWLLEQVSKTPSK